MASITTTLAVLVVGLCASAATAYTDPGDVAKLIKLRDAIRLQHGTETAALLDWECQMDPCDPCSDSGNWGRWGGLHCRAGDGRVTGIHLTDLECLRGGSSSKTCISGINIPREVCLFGETLTELDLDSQDFTGTVPSWLGDCLPNLQELDLEGNGNLSGELLRVQAADVRLGDTQVYQSGRKMLRAKA